MWRKSEENRVKSFADATPVSDSSKQHSGPAAAAGSPSDVAAVSKRIKFRGEITGQGDFFFDGEFEGKIHLDDGTFTVGPNARVNGEIEARQIIVRGEVLGGLKAHERIYIASTAKLTGNMDTRGIVIEDGAELHSKVASPQKAAPQSAEPKVVPSEADGPKVATPETAKPEASKAEAAPVEPATLEKEQAPPPARGKRAAAAASTTPASPAPGSPSPQSDSQES